MIRYAMTILTVAMRDRKGVTAMEYGVLAAAIVGVLAVAAGTLGTAISTLFGGIAGDLVLK